MFHGQIDVEAYLWLFVHRNAYIYIYTQHIYRYDGERAHRQPEHYE